jgi:hypothetical protein
MLPVLIFTIFNLSLLTLLNKPYTFRGTVKHRYRYVPETPTFINSVLEHWYRQHFTHLNFIFRTFFITSDTEYWYRYHLSEGWHYFITLTSNFRTCFIISDTEYRYRYWFHLPVHREYRYQHHLTKLNLICRTCFIISDTPCRYQYHPCCDAGTGTHLHFF